MGFSLQNRGFGQAERVWIRFSLALAACAGAVLFQILIDRLSAQPVTPFLLAFAAIIVSASWAGAVPGLAATAALVIWSAVDLSWHQISPGSIALRCSIFLLEGAVVSIGSARLWRSVKEAAASESWHRQLVETAAEGIWIHDDDGVITYANARMAEMLAVPGEALPGRNISEFIFPEDYSMERVRAANLRNGLKEQFDRRLRRADGAELWVLTSANLLDPGGLYTGKQKSAARGLLAMMTDITERKRAEYALRRSEERFRGLFENVLEGVYQSTPDGRILAANPMILEMFGIEKGELNEINIATDFFPEPDLRKRLLERMERDGGYQNVEYELRRRDGQIITVLENARVVRDESGAVLYYEGTMTDVTPRRRMEEQLRQAQKVEALGRLAGSIAGDFNNILTVITGYAELALGEVASGHPARSSVEQVLEAANRAMNLTQQLLLFSRRQAPREIVDLNQAVTHSDSVRKTGLKLALCNEPLLVQALPEQIERVIRELCSNLRARFPTAVLQVKSETAFLDENVSQRFTNSPGGSFALLSLGDLRSGRPARRLFEDPLVGAMQAGESAATGLSEVHAIVAQCGGFMLTNASPASAHPAMHVFLPVAAKPVDDLGRSPKSAPAGRSILLVEEEPLIRELSRDMLERQGYRVILASNAREAEQMSRNAGAFDLLITDTIMPDITGAELARRLRQAHPDLKVLYVSSFPEDTADRAKAAEKSAYLHKPFSAESLGRKIRQLLG